MSNAEKKVITAVEEWSIPTYDFPEPENMPMFAENTLHQGTTGNPYPARIVSHVDATHCEEKKWTVVRMENDYIRLAIIPALGGRIFEAYDKTTGYDFLYRQHVIKPALIGVYGLWISGGLEFNWPFHHRPSTVMPVDFTLEHEPDGTAILWLSEHAPNDRTKGMVGIVLRPDSSFFETRMAVTNRTPDKHSFLWWENAAVAVHEDYRLVFPPDVTWVHHHYDRGHTTFPLASGQYGADNITEPKDISWHGNSKIATSYFAAPSKFDFFGGYDHRRECGVLHIADHHLSPGKKMFTWGYGKNAEEWEKKLTDSDGAYAELMAGSYTDDQPDFTWLAPYETKTFSQYWYPTENLGYATYATLDAAICLDRDENRIRLNVTSCFSDCRLVVKGSDGRILLDKNTAMTPSKGVAFPLDYPENEKLSVFMYADGTLLLSYTEEDHDYIHIPKDNTGTPLPDQLKTPCELVTAGQHIDQYRDVLYKPDIYYLEALRRDPEYTPAHKALGEYYTRVARFEDALPHLDKAWAEECVYNQNPEDGTVGYTRGLCLLALGRTEEAYAALNRAAWSNNVLSPAYTILSALDLKKGDYAAAFHHANMALEKEYRNPLGRVYAALALYKSKDGYKHDTYYGATLGKKIFANGERQAIALCREALKIDPLNHTARFVLCFITGKGRKAFFASLCSDPAQTALDIAFDLLRAGCVAETVSLIKGVLPYAKDRAMLCYTLGYCFEQLGDMDQARKQRKAARKNMFVASFPIRAGEFMVLESALRQDEHDGFAAYLLGCIRYNTQQYELAATLWEKAIKNLPRFYIPYRNLALVYYNHLDRANDALSLLRRAIELHPGDETLLSEIARVMQNLGASGDENIQFLEQYKPEKATDQMQLALARAYNAACRFEEAEAIMRAHTFSPGEGAEFLVAEPYLYACFARGRIAMKEQRYADALELFRRAQNLPKNLNVGFWNESVTIPYRYSEACALVALGKTDEANELVAQLSKMKDVGMWNMGGEFAYYYALSLQLGGNSMRAQEVMRNAILAWEKELAGGCKYHRMQETVCNCFVGNGTANRRARLYTMLGYGDLFNGKIEDAKEKFRRSLECVPTAKVQFELSLLD